MSRNKENAPLTSSSRVRSSIPSLMRSPDKEEFFTNSVLDIDASQTSLIPTPSHQKGPITRPRRKIGSNRPLHLTNGQQRTNKYASHISKPTRPTRTSSSPNQGQGLSTPPQSRDGLSLTSPISTASSPPEALTDVYQRIEQEEDLAATEGEISDPDDLIVNRSVNGTSQPPNRRLFSQSRSRSRGSTPTQEATEDDKENIDYMESMSEATGMSFLQGLSDQNLAAKITPLALESARDRAELDRVWRHQRPVAFSKAGSLRGLHAVNVSSSPPQRLVAFSKAGKLPSQLHQRGFSDGTGRFGSTASDEGHLHNDIWHDDDRLRHPLPLNPRIERRNYFARNHGFPAHALTEQNLGVQNGRENKHISDSPGSVSTYHSEPPPSALRSWPIKLRSQINQGGSSNSKYGKQEHDSSAVDWAQAAADVPLPSVEDSSGIRRVDSPNILSPEKSRRWDNDFTGQSFQVSESPPVRSRPQDKETQGVPKQVVATNRLSQIREQSPRESLRRDSRSPAPDLQPTLEEGVKNVPEGIVGTSSQNVSSNATSTDHMHQDRSQSHDYLQRLARGLSNTPRSSSSTISRESIIKSLQNGQREEQYAKKSSPAPTKTPKITGAWTDTILPDTVKTNKHEKPSLYSQTPHVRAGGWIETPLPVGQAPLPLSQEIIHEVPEGLTGGIVNDMPEGEESVEVSSAVARGPQKPKSVAQKILGEAKLKLSQDLKDDVKDDDLNLNNTTIQSLEDILNMGPDDLTILSRLDDTLMTTKEFPQSDADVLERLVTKLDRLRHTIHDARKGISKLEHQVSLPDLPEPPNTAVVDEVAPNFPATRITISVPILFHPRKQNERLPRPTALGWLTLSIWTWYILECTMAEMFSHPLYAEYYSWPLESEPRFPYVLPTMLLRWSRLEFIGIWILKPVWTLLVAFFRLIGVWFGLSDGFVGDGVKTAQKMAFPTMTLSDGPDMGFMNDDFL